MSNDIRFGKDPKSNGFSSNKNDVSSHKRENISFLAERKKIKLLGSLENGEGIERSVDSGGGEVPSHVHRKERYVMNKWIHAQVSTAFPFPHLHGTCRAVRLCLVQKDRFFSNFLIHSLHGTHFFLKKNFLLPELNAANEQPQCNTAWIFVKKNTCLDPVRQNLRFRFKILS